MSNLHKIPAFQINTNFRLSNLYKFGGKGGQKFSGDFKYQLLLLRDYLSVQITT